MNNASGGLQMCDQSQNAERMVDQHRYCGTDNPEGWNRSPSEDQNRKQRDADNRPGNCNASRSPHVTRSPNNGRECAEKPKADRPTEYNVRISDRLIE